jgi:hypothetical protein
MAIGAGRRSLEEITGSRPAVLAVPDNARFAGRTLRTLVRAGVGFGVALAVNVVVLFIAIPIGLYVGELFWAVVLGEAALLVGCLLAAGVAALRARRGLGLGLLVGWAAGYVGLVVTVALIAIAVIVIAAVLWVLWLLLAGFVSLVAG